VLITGPGTFPLPDGRRLLVTLHSDRRNGTDAARVEFSAEEISFPLTVRTARPGDRFCPDGMPGSKKLKDLFIDAKLTKEARAVQPLVVRGNEILWVVGMRRCRGYHVRDSAVLSLSVVSD
jgi:tRNA(Ile)-lysidine synthase